MSARRPTRVLFVDDDQHILALLDRFFGGRGYETRSAVRGRDGLDAHARFEPDVTVLDLDLPDISGMDVLAELRRRHAMVIMLTGTGEIEDAVQAMRLGAENFLTKPINMGHLEAVVGKAAEKRALRSENIRLRARLTPTWKRRLIRGAASVGLAVVSAGVGVWIGAGTDQPVSRRPIPVPIDSADAMPSAGERPSLLPSPRQGR